MSSSLRPQEALQASLPITLSWTLLKFMSIELVMLTNHLILCRPLLSCPQSFPAAGSFPMNQLFASGGQSLGASASVPLMNIQGWFPLGLISLHSKGLISFGIDLLALQRSPATPQFKSINSSVLSLLYGPTITSIHAAATAAMSLQLCPTLCSPIDCSPPGSPVPGILQPRTLEWVAISFSNAWNWKVKVKSLSRVWLLATTWTTAYQAPPSMGFSRQEYWSGVPLPSLHPHMTTGKTITLNMWTFVGKVMSLLFNMLSRFVIEGNKLGPKFGCLWTLTWEF